MQSRWPLFEVKKILNKLFTRKMMSDNCIINGYYVVQLENLVAIDARYLTL